MRAQTRANRAAVGMIKRIGGQAFEDRPVAVADEEDGHVEGGTIFEAARGIEANDAGGDLEMSARSGTVGHEGRHAAVSGAGT